MAADEVSDLTAPSSHFNTAATIPAPTGAALVSDLTAPSSHFNTNPPETAAVATVNVSDLTAPSSHFNRGPWRLSDRRGRWSQISGL